MSVSLSHDFDDKNYALLRLMKNDALNKYIRAGQFKLFGIFTLLHVTKGYRANIKLCET